MLKKETLSLIQIVEYDPFWPGQFLSLRTSISEAVGPYALAIEHVGSTSVPDLAAKPVIDIDVVVKPDDVQAAIQALAQLGYQHRGDLGIPEREAFLAPEGPIEHNLYVCPVGSEALANHLAVRDYLRKHPEEVLRYGELKIKLAQTCLDDIDAYIAGKSAFLGELLEKCGFTGEQLQRIQEMNRKPERP